MILGIAMEPQPVLARVVGFLPADPDEKSSESEESVVTSPSPETTKPAKDGDVNSEPKPPSKPEPKPKAAVPEVSKNSGPEEPGSRTVAAQKVFGAPPGNCG